MDSDARFPGPGRSLEHEYYAGLCALATSGSLNHEEERELAAHLTKCQLCRDLLLEYRTVATSAMAVLAAANPAQPLESSESWSPETAKRQLLARIAAENAAPTPQLISSRSELLPMWRRFFLPSAFGKLQMGGALALMVLALALSYRLGENYGVRKAGRPAQPLLSAQHENPDQNAAVSNRAGDTQRELLRLQDELQRQITALSSFQSLHRQLQQESEHQTSEIAALSSEKSSIAAERDAANRHLQETQEALLAAQQRLDDLREESGRQSLHTASLQLRVDDLNARLRESDAILQRTENFLASDRDIRELMGARDLYIADVFDIDREGKTQKAFGRVFYTGGKSLIFYAFDLDRQPGARELRTYQAWGRRGPSDKRPLNMGVLSLDNAANQRWVLRFDDQKLLAQIDAVFVTVESHGAAQKPTGKQLLFASLRTPPNHP
jgi:hypothetical protein